MVYSTNSSCSVRSMLQIPSKSHTTNVNSEYLIITLSSLTHLQKAIPIKYIFRECLQIFSPYCLASRKSCTILQKRCIHSSCFSLALTWLLNSIKSFVISSVITIKSQQDPKIKSKNIIAVPNAVIVPANWISHAKKYPNGVFHSNGHLHI